MADSSAGYQLVISNGAKDDLDECAAKDPAAAAFLARFLRELRSRPDYLERMIDTGHNDDVVDSICEVWSLQNKRINAYRTKFVNIRSWRLIFVVDRSPPRIGLFAVMRRDIDYATELMRDIEREFDELGFKKY